MSIKKQMQFNRSDFTYESDDGESYAITYVDTGDREYFEVSKVGSTDEKKVYDVKMWKEFIIQSRQKGTVASKRVAKFIANELKQEVV